MAAQSYPNKGIVDKKLEVQINQRDDSDEKKSAQTHQPIQLSKLA